MLFYRRSFIRRIIWHCDRHTLTSVMPILCSVGSSVRYYRTCYHGLIYGHSPAMPKMPFRKHFFILPGLLAGLVLAIDNWLPYSLLSHHKRSVNPQPPILQQYQAIAEPIAFKTQDGMKIAGWFIPAKTNAATRPTLILLHGLGGKREDWLDFGLPIWQQGFNLALIDLRGHGGSDGEFFTYGYHEWKDVAGVIDFLEQRKLSKQIAVMGMSAGGAVAVSSAAQDKRIRALITIGAFADLSQTIERQSQWLPGFWREHAKSKAEQMAQFQISKASAIAQIQTVECPVLIAHGTADTYIPFSDGDQIYQNARSQKTFYAIADATHADMLIKHRAQLKGQIIQFLKQQFERS